MILSTAAASSWREQPRHDRAGARAGEADGRDERNQGLAILRRLGLVEASVFRERDGVVRDHVACLCRTTLINPRLPSLKLWTGFLGAKTRAFGVLCVKGRSTRCGE